MSDQPTPEQSDQPTDQWPNQAAEQQVDQPTDQQAAQPTVPPSESDEPVATEEVTPSSTLYGRSRVILPPPTELPEANSPVAQTEEPDAPLTYDGAFHLLPR